jgi:LysR family transcriptional activator of glutamate synthase operon
MDLLQLEYFREAALREHITQASNALHITQPTLSKVIARLEDELGCRLFSREGKNVQLTQEGKILLYYTNGIFDQLDQLRSELADVKEGNAGHLSIGSCFPPREPPKVWDLTTSFMWDHPDISISIIQLQPDGLRQALLCHEIDLAMTTVPIAGKGIEWIPLYDEPVGVIIARDHPLAQQEVISLSDLHDFTFMCNDTNSDEANLTRTCCIMAGYEPRIIYAACVPALIGRAVSRGKAVSFISKAAEENQEHRGEDWEDNVVFRPLAESYCVRRYGIAVQSGVYHSNALVHYLTTILSSFGMDKLPFELGELPQGEANK